MKKKGKMYITSSLSIYLRQQDLYIEKELIPLKRSKDKTDVTHSWPLKLMRLSRATQQEFSLWPKLRHKRQGSTKAKVHSQVKSTFTPSLITDRVNVSGAPFQIDWYLGENEWKIEFKISFHSCQLECKLNFNFKFNHPLDWIYSCWLAHFGTSGVE